MKKYKVGIYKRNDGELVLKGMFEETCDTIEEATDAVDALNNENEDDGIVYDIIEIQVFDALSARDSEIEEDLLELYRTSSEFGGKTKDEVEKLIPKYQEMLKDDIRNYLIFKLTTMANSGKFKRVFSPTHEEFIYKTM